MSQNNTVPISKIIADPNQPRKYFDVAKLASLRRSVKAHGIVSPLIVEEKDGKFLLVDGERRLRVAQELGLKEIPITVISSKDPAGRLVEQFHIQEMHEGWTPVEKAMVISGLTDELGKSFIEVCELLNIPRRTANGYYALTRISAKNDFTASGMSIQFAEPMSSLNNYVKKLKNDQLEETFTPTDQRKLEKMIIKEVAGGSIVSVRDLSRLKDTFKSDPRTIDKYLDGADSEQLYIKSKAKSAYHLRNAVNNGGFVTSHIRSFLEHPDVKLTTSDIGVLKSLKIAVNNMLSAVGE